MCSTAVAPDILLGGDGNDTLCGGAGDDILDSGAGDELLVGGTGSVLICSDAAWVTTQLTRSMTRTATIPK